MNRVKEGSNFDLVKFVHASYELSERTGEQSEAR